MRLPEDNGDFEYLQDEIVSLAEDIIELDDIQQKTLDCLVELSKIGLDATTILEAYAKALEEEVKSREEGEIGMAILMGIILVIVLLLSLHALNVF